MKITGIAFLVLVVVTMCIGQTVLAQDGDVGSEGKT